MVGGRGTCSRSRFPDVVFSRRNIGSSIGRSECRKQNSVRGAAQQRSFCPCRGLDWYLRRSAVDGPAVVLGLGQLATRSVFVIRSRSLAVGPVKDGTRTSFVVFNSGDL